MSETRAYSWLRPLKGRNPNEEHRAATPLELFFDLVFVVAIAQAAAGLHHGIAEDHIVEALVNYVLAFFAIWWAWMSFTWFASSYDNDDVGYRLGVFGQLTGAIVLAAGIGRIFENRDFTMALIGYIIMRVVLIVQFLRAAKDNPKERQAELSLAGLLIVLQAMWALLVLVAPKSWIVPGAITLGGLEMVAYAWAAGKRVERTWHREHIAERYGLLTIIVLGETMLAASFALEAIFAAGEFEVGLLPLLLGGLLTVFSLWWLYFDEDASYLLDDMKTGFLWGYGHYVIFAAAAAVGAGLAISLDVATHHAHVSELVGALSIAIPTALFVLGVWFLQERPSDSNDGNHLPLGALLIVAAAWAPQPALAIGLLMAVLVGIKVAWRVRESAVSGAPPS